MPTEHAKITVSAKEWWSYEWAAICEASSEISRAAIYRSLSGPTIFLVAQHMFHLIKEHQTWLMVLLPIASAVAVFLIEFIFRIFVLAPAKLYKKGTVQLQKASEEVSAFRLEKEEKPRLEIEYKSSNDNFASPHIVGEMVVSVKNTSKTTTINNVELIVEWADPPNAPHVFLPSPLQVFNIYKQQIKFCDESVHPTKSALFILSQLMQKGAFHLAIKDSHETVYDLMNPQQFPAQNCVFGLEARAKDVLPVTAQFKLSMDGQKIKAELLPSQ